MENRSKERLLVFILITTQSTSLLFEHAPLAQLEDFDRRLKTHTQDSVLRGMPQMDPTIELEE